MLHPFKEWNYNGWEYENQVDTFTRHSGMDYNWKSGHSDFGKNIECATDMEIIWIKNTLSTGWGRVIIGYSRRYDRWFRYAHLKQINVNVGDHVKEGDSLGECGGSGFGSEKYWWSHVHFDVIKLKLSNWLSYTKYWTLKKLHKYYEDPLVFIEEKNRLEQLDKPQEEPEIIQWSKKTGIRKTWSANPSEIDVNNAYAQYKGLYMIASNANRKKYFTIKELNNSMDESLNNFK